MLEVLSLDKPSVCVPNNAERKLATRAPKVTSRFLQGVPTGFASFINDAVCGEFMDRLLGTDNDAAFLLSELRRLSPACVTSRGRLKRWIGETWLVSTTHPVKRGQAYWHRVGSIIWEVYESALDLRHRTKRAIKLEVERLARADKRKAKKVLAARARRKAQACKSSTKLAEAEMKPMRAGHTYANEEVSHETK